jgi:hypothetical protein
MRTFSLVLAALFCAAMACRADDTAAATQPAPAPTNDAAANDTAAPPSNTVTSETSGTPSDGDSTANKQHINFDGEKFLFAWEGASKTAKIKEFLPAGQNLDTWTRFVAINEYPHVNDPRDFAHNIVHALRKANPKTPAQMQENSKTGEIVLDFVTWPEDLSFVEFNVFKFHKVPGGGIVGEQYAQRAYTADDQKLPLDRLETLKKHVVPLMAEHGLQVSTEQ